MYKFKAPKKHYFDFTGILTRFDKKRVDKYIQDIDQEISYITKYLEKLQDQRSEAVSYRIYDMTGIEPIHYNEYLEQKRKKAQ